MLKLELGIGPGHSRMAARRSILAAAGFQLNRTVPVSVEVAIMEALCSKDAKLS
jgi:hypothetical protein